MNYKSYLIEENVELLKNHIALFYGENLGLINFFKKKITEKHKKILRFTQEDVLKDHSKIFNEIKNISLFDDKKIIFISNVNDKLLDVIKEVSLDTGDNKIFLFANILEKKSKLRSFFEKTTNCDVVTCYKDNDISIKKLIHQDLKGYAGLTPEIVNLLVDNSSLDRIKLLNELDKIKNLFLDKKIKSDQLVSLLDQKTDNEFNTIKDSALTGNNKLTNNLLSSTVFEIEKMSLYLGVLNQRLNKLMETTLNAKDGSLVKIIDNMKPPIFWKDKPAFLNQAKLWNKNKINLAFKKTYELELNIKSNGNVDKTVLIKKLLLDICLLANA
jgi:DNA polymerase-3 subunit delta